MKGWWRHNFELERQVAEKAIRTASVRTRVELLIDELRKTLDELEKELAEIDEDCDD
jgi:hypothetical protein